AVPTDVESHQHLRLRAHAAADQGRLVVRGTTQNMTAGVGACIVRRTDDDGPRFVVSCHHVLGMTEHGPGEFPVGADVSFGAIKNRQVQALAPVVGNSSSFYGVLRTDVPGVSFDAALARVRSGQEVSARELVPAPPGPQPAKYARFKSEIEELETFSMRCANGV